MKHIYYSGQVLWSQMDANNHLRHSSYADLCAQARINMLTDVGLSMQELENLQIGPILFREELVYLREVRLNELINVQIEITRYNHSNSRFSFRHSIWKENEVLAAVVTVDGAWMDLKKRKLTTLPEEWTAYFGKIPKSEDYQETK